MAISVRFETEFTEQHGKLSHTRTQATSFSQTLHNTREYEYYHSITSIFNIYASLSLTCRICQFKYNRCKILNNSINGITLIIGQQYKLKQATETRNNSQRLNVKALPRLTTHWENELITHYMKFIIKFSYF